MIIFNSIMLVSSIIQMSLGKGDVLHHLVRLKPRVTFEYTQVMILRTVYFIRISLLSLRCYYTFQVHISLKCTFTLCNCDRLLTTLSYSVTIYYIQ